MHGVHNHISSCDGGRCMRAHMYLIVSVTCSKTVYVHMQFARNQYSNSYNNYFITTKLDRIYNSTADIY